LFSVNTRKNVSSTELYYNNNNIATSIAENNQEYKKVCFRKPPI